MVTAKNAEESPPGTDASASEKRYRYDFLARPSSWLIGLGVGIAINDLSNLGIRLAVVAIILGFILKLANRLRARPMSYLHIAVVWASVAFSIAAACGIGFGPSSWRPYCAGVMVVLALIVAVLPRNTVLAMTILVAIFAVSGGLLGALSHQHVLNVVARNQAWMKIPVTGFILVAFVLFPMCAAYGSKAAMGGCLLIGGICGYGIGIAYGIHHNYLFALTSVGASTGPIITGCLWLKNSSIHGWLNQAWAWLTKERPEKLFF